MKRDSSICAKNRTILDMNQKSRNTFLKPERNYAE